MKYLFEWTDALSVNQIAIDAQHRQLFNQINVLLSAIINNLEPKVVDEAVAFLGQYIDGHLKYEEQYMADNNYPELEAHKVAHHDFIKNYEDVKEKKSAGAPIESLALEIEQYLGKWLTEHIAKMDHQYAEYINNKLVRG